MCTSQNFKQGGLDTDDLNLVLQATKNNYRWVDFILSRHNYLKKITL